MKTQVPFDYAQGRLSTPCRFAMLRVRTLSDYSNLVTDF
jgi:hypothetical protein